MNTETRNSINAALLRSLAASCNPLAGCRALDRAEVFAPSARPATPAEETVRVLSAALDSAPETVAAGVVAARLAVPVLTDDAAARAATIIGRRGTFSITG